MTDTTVIALIGGVTSITASLIAAYSAKQASNKAAESVSEAKITSRKVDEVSNTTAEIHQLTNSHLSEITSQLKVALERISGLEKTATALAKERLNTDQERAAERLKSDLENGSKRTDETPIPVKDDAVLDILTPKLDDIQKTVNDKTE